MQQAFQTRLRQLFSESHMTQEAFAKKIGISRPSLNQYMQGQRVPNAEKLAQIASRCNVSVDWLVDDSIEARSPDASIQAAGKLLHLSDEAMSEIAFLANNRCGAVLEELLTNPHFEEFLFCIEKAINSRKETIMNTEDDPQKDLVDPDYLFSDYEHLKIIASKKLDRLIDSMPGQWPPKGMF